MNLFEMSVAFFERYGQLVPNPFINGVGLLEIPFSVFFVLSIFPIPCAMLLADELTGAKVKPSQADLLRSIFVKIVMTFVYALLMYATLVFFAYLDGPNTAYPTLPLSDLHYSLGYTAITILLPTSLLLPILFVFRSMRKIALMAESVLVLGIIIAVFAGVYVYPVMAVVMVGLYLYLTKTSWAKPTLV